jgi:hypothetical protein
VGPDPPPATSDEVEFLIDETKSIEEIHESPRRITGNVLSEIDQYLLQCFPMNPTPRSDHASKRSLCGFDEGFKLKEETRRLATGRERREIG